MKKIGKIAVGLLCFIVVSCSSRQVTGTAISTYKPELPSNPTMMITPIFSYPTMNPGGFLATGKRGVNFIKWHVSFVLPADWDDKKFESGDDGGFDEELYSFIGPEIKSDHRLTNAEINVSFHPFKDDPEKNAFLAKPFLEAGEIRLEFEKSYSPEEIGLDLDSAVVYKCNFIVGIRYACYVIRATYKNAGIKIWMNADSYIFSQVESQFLETIRSISFY